ncbi:uncharacterized protein LOC122253574 isoform X1 [Penaeus japonicus]|uniref:uncharacterized protein LOC122253574 isoform X1 n=1 Tax=Penaeus japonicus TaxID=27405 RepID=UPI001C716145|nr:uncharacterized protein LOC122253574 isoform X1 [Penaeus japonicus]
MFTITPSATQRTNSLPVVWTERDLDEEGGPGSMVAVPRTALRLMASISLGMDVVAAGIQGSVLEREERAFYRCLLKAEGIVVGSRWDAPPTKVPLSSCYANDVRVVRTCTCTGAVALVGHIIAVFLLLVALAIGRRRLSSPWVGFSLLVTLQEVILVGAYWSLLHAAEVTLLGCHALMLAVSVVLVLPFLQESVAWAPASAS